MTAPSETLRRQAPPATFARPRRSPLAPLRRIPDPVFAWLLLIPALLFLAGFTLYPTIRAGWDSLQEPGINGGVGPAYYREMLGDTTLRRALLNNVIFSLITVPISLAVAMLMATLINKQMRMRGAIRLAYFTPAMLPIVAAAGIWLLFYQPNFGAINTIARWFGLTAHNWLGSTSTVLPAIMVMMIWHEAGFFMLFYLAGLQLISPELIEASMLEGSTKWYHFRRVTFPLLMPTTLFATIVGIANSFRQVDFIFVMTQGGPNNASNMLLYYIWEVAFSHRRPEYADAITLLLVLILITLAVLQIRLLERRIHYR